MQMDKHLKAQEIILKRRIAKDIDL